MIVWKFIKLYLHIGSRDLRISTGFWKGEVCTLKGFILMGVHSLTSAISCPKLLSPLYLKEEGPAET